jgi:hypothetical protein
LVGAVPPFAVIVPKRDCPPLFTEVEAAPWVLIAAPPAPTVTAMLEDDIEKLELSTTAPPPPPCGHHTAACPAPPLLPPPTTNTRTEVTPAGTAQSQLPTSAKVKTVAPPTIVDVGSHVGVFACAGIATGIETNNPEISVAITIETIFDRAALTFMRTKSRITFTSLFSN